MFSFSDEELRAILFHRDQVLKKPAAEDLPTLLDADEHKLPALNMLLKHMGMLFAELTAMGLPLQSEEVSSAARPNCFMLQDSEYRHWPQFEIRIQSNWLDSTYPLALHAGFDFHLYVIQDGYKGRGEIADWINIRIRHLNTTPLSFASSREHVRALGLIASDRQSYFHDLPMAYTTAVSFDRLHEGLSFKTDAFNRAAADACHVLFKITARKRYLSPLGEKEVGDSPMITLPPP